MSESTQPGSDGLTRRELLRKGAILGGALAWSIPTIQTIGMSPALAAPTSFAISYVAFVLQCGDEYFRAKYEVGGGWSTGDQALPCENNTFREWPSTFTYTDGPPPGGLANPSGSGSLTFNFGDCTVVWSLNKCGQVCIETNGDQGSTPTFDPCPNPNA